MNKDEIAFTSTWAIIPIALLIYLAIDKRARNIVLENWITALMIISLLICIVLFGLFIMNGVEGFQSGAETTSGCFSDAKRGPDGKIHVQPGDKTFNNMSEYVSALSDQYAAGKLCVPPQVKTARSPTAGILGGLGTNTIGPAGVKQENATRVVTESDVDRPWDKTPINSVGDYDRTQVYENERASRQGAMSTAVINELSNQYKMDWSQLPFNSEAKAAQEDIFTAGRMNSMYREPVTGVFFKNMEGDSLLPPNTDEQNKAEMRILNSYVPPKVVENKEQEETVTIANLVKKLFAGNKDYTPVVEKTGNNNWAITELVPKAKKESWADAEKGTSIDSAVRAGWIPPQASMEIFDHGTNDPAFYKAGVADNDNGRFWNYKDFNKFTPGLERMYAPTLQTREWY
jgi:hypothetical protein